MITKVLLFRSLVLGVSVAFSVLAFVTSMLLSQAGQSSGLGLVAGTFLAFWSFGVAQYMFGEGILIGVALVYAQAVAFAYLITQRPDMAVVTGAGIGMIVLSYLAGLFVDTFSQLEEDNAAPAAVTVNQEPR